MSIRQGNKVIAGHINYHPDLFDHKWADHLLNDISWLRADTFSWQDGAVYQAAYQHLSDDLGAKMYYGWTRTVVISETTYEFTLFTLSENPTTEDVVYDYLESAGKMRNATEHSGTVIDGVENNYISVHTSDFPMSTRYDRDTTKDGVYVSVANETETISGITITYYPAPDGHKICPASEESNVAAIYAATGIAWYYVLDTVNERFKLPRTKFGFNGLRDTVGKYIEPGLPNITGEIIGSSSRGIAGSADGCFYISTKQGTVSTNTTNERGNVYMDASRSSSIYGNSTTVQPPATQQYLYFYVGNFTQTALENTAGLNASLFNGKADIDFNNTSMIDYVIAKQDPNAGNNYTWYRKYKSGWVEQGGYTTGGNNTATSIVFPIAMNDEYYSLAIAGYHNGNATSSGTPSYRGIYGDIGTITGRTSTGFTLGNGTNITWQVSGKAA